MIQDLALILIVAGVVTLLFKKLKQPVVLGYIVAGFLVSPHMPYIPSIIEETSIKEWADIGVMFTLFSLGLDFSFKKIVKMGVAPIISALTIVTCMLMTGYVVGHALGWGQTDCIFLGGMLAMSSTTIIYKAFADLGLLQQRFASLVMSVLILEDILAIVMMVMLAAIAGGDSPSGSDMLMSILRIAFFLILWFVVGIFAIPAMLRKVRKLMTSETLLIVALGLCCLMAVLSMQAGFSSAFGAFVMGSILAETIEAEKIEKVIEPVKNLFGAIFFVSVGMLVQVDVLIDYAAPIIAIVLTILVGQAVFGTLGFFLSGQPLKTAMRCGFSMAQIGEFAFIIASLGMSMKVIAPFLYPVVVAVSVITTFLTPYMIRGALPAYNFLEKHLPSAVIIQLNHLVAKLPVGDNHDTTDTSGTLGTHGTPDTHGTHGTPGTLGTPDTLGTIGTSATHDTPARTLWRTLLRSMLINTVVYGIVIFAITALMLSFVLLTLRGILPHWWANGVTGLLNVVCIAPFLRAIVMKKNHSEEWKQLWHMSALNRLPLISTIVARAAVCLAFLFYICNYLARFDNAIVICLGIIVIVLVVLSRAVKQRSIRMERLFLNNLRSREVAAQVTGEKLPEYANHLVERDLTLTEVVVPENSLWAGQTLAELQLGRNFGVHISSILRDGRRLNIPLGVEQIFSGDKLQVIGSDDQIANLNKVMQGAVYPEDERDIEDREMIMKQIVLTRKSPVIGKTLKDSRLREDFSLLVVGIEQGQNDLTDLNVNHVFQVGDIVWMVGERPAFERFE